MTCSRPAALALATAGILMSGAVQAQAQTNLSPGQIIRASLDAADPQLPDKSHYDCYVVETRPGQSILVEQTSGMFDTFLLAGTGRDCGALSTLRNDDAPGKGTNSALTLIGDGQPWFVVASSFEGNKTGAYVLKATASTTMVTDFADVETMTVGQWRAPRPIDIGSIRASDVSVWSNQVDDDGDFYNCYSFVAQRGVPVTITLDSAEFDPIIVVHQGGRCTGDELAEDDDSGGDFNARLVFTPPADGQYSYRAQALDDIMTSTFEGAIYRTSLMPGQ